MTRLIDADALRDKLQAEIDKGIPPFDDVMGSIRCGIRLARNIVEDEPTIDAVPTEFVMEIGCLEFVCDELTDDGEWCSERCQYSEPQPECIHRYIDRIWRKEHAETD